MADNHAAAAGAHTTQDAGHKAGFPPFDASTFPSQLLWFAIAFGALYLLMSKVALPRVGAIINSRESKISGDLDIAAAAQKQAADAAAAHEKTLTDARSSARELGQQTGAKLAAESDVKRKTVEAGLNAKLAAAEAQISATKQAAMGNVSQIAEETAAAIVQQLTGRAAPADVVAKAVAAARNG